MALAVPGLKRATGNIPVVAIALIALLCSATGRAHSGGGNRLQWEVCASSELGERCEWTDARGSLYRGTCRRISGALMCVRNRPIIKAAKNVASQTGDHDHDHDHDHDSSSESETEPIAWLVGLVAFILVALVWFLRFWGKRS